MLRDLQVLADDLRIQRELLDLVSRKTPPGEDLVSGAFLAGGLYRLQCREVVGILPPGQVAIGRARRIQASNPTASRIVELHSVPRVLAGGDAERQQRTFLAPREVGDVAQRDLRVAGEIDHEQVGAPSLGLLRSVAEQTEKPPGLVEREPGDLVETPFLIGRELEQRRAIARRLSRLRQLLAFLFPTGPCAGDPLAVPGECRRLAPGNDSRFLRLGLLQSQLEVAVDPPDVIGHPGAVGREGRPASQAFPLAVVLGLESRFACRSLGSRHRAVDGKSRSTESAGSRIARVRAFSIVRGNRATVRSWTATCAVLRRGRIGGYHGVQGLRSRRDARRYSWPARKNRPSVSGRPVESGV